MAETTHRIARASAANALELRGVGRAFGALVAVADIDLTVAAGERRAVLGANGAGKTTLFNTITGDFPPTSGRIRFFGEDVTQLPAHERIRRGLRRTYQNSMLFRTLSVLDNLYLAARGVTRGRMPGTPFYLSMTDVLSRKLLLGMCSDSEGYLISQNVAVREQSNAALGSFLTEALR